MDDGTQMGWDVDIETANISTEPIYAPRSEPPVDMRGTVTVTGRYRSRIQQGDPHFEPQPGIDPGDPS